MDLTDSQEELKDQLVDMKAQLSVIQAQLAAIIQLLEKNQNSCQRMDSHIDKVETAYSSVRVPLNFLRDRMAYLSAFRMPELPAIGDKPENPT